MLSKKANLKKIVNYSKYLKTFNDKQALNLRLLRKHGEKFEII